jgi:hypothetical protein
MTETPHALCWAAYWLCERLLLCVTLNTLICSCCRMGCLRAWHCILERALPHSLAYFSVMPLLKRVVGLLLPSGAGEVVLQDRLRLYTRCSLHGGTCCLDPPVVVLLRRAACLCWPRNACGVCCALGAHSGTLCTLTFLLLFWPQIGLPMQLAHTTRGQRGW